MVLVERVWLLPVLGVDLAVEDFVQALVLLFMVPRVVLVLVSRVRLCAF